MSAASDVVVVGAGLAGLLAAERLSAGGATVTLVGFGIGGLQLGHGCLDILGYAPDAVSDPLAAIDSLPAEHPYRVLGADAARAGVEAAVDFFGPELLTGSATRNLWLPTALGGLRPTAFASPSMLEAVAHPEKLLVAGPRQLKDFHPELIAANLARVLPDSEVRAISFDLPARAGEADSTALNYARGLDAPELRDLLVLKLAKLAKPGETLLVPAMLGLADLQAWRKIAQRVGAPIAEIPLPPPGVPGMRLNAHALAALKARGVRIIQGSRVVKLNGADRITSVELATTGHPTTIKAGAVVYAPGGFESGALRLDSYGELSDALGLPVWRPAGEPFSADRRADQPIFRAGLQIDPDARVLDAAGRVVHANLFAAGGVLAGAMRWREKSGEGIAAASALRAAEGVLR